MSFLRALTRLFDDVSVAGASRFFFTTVSVTDTALDVGLLATEVAKAVMGDDFDPALRDRAEEVIEAGRIYDEKLDEVARRRDEVIGITDGIRSVTGNVIIDFGERVELVREKLNSLVLLRETLNNTQPRLHSWFNARKLQPLILEQPFDEIENQVAAQLQVNGPNTLIIVSSTLSLGINAGLSAWGHFRGNGQRPPVGSLGEDADAPTNEPFRRMNATTRAEIEDLRNRLDTKITVPRNVVNDAHTVASRGPGGNVFVNGVVNAVRILSFGMSLYGLATLVRQRNEAMDALNEMLDHYQNATPLYDHILNGIPDAAAFDKVVEFFELTESDLSDDSREGLEEGILHLQHEHDDMLKDILDGMDASYLDMITEFKAVEEVADPSIISSLEAAHTVHKEAQSLALDTDRSVDIRVDDGITVARDGFNASVSNQLNETLAALSVAIDEYNAFRMIVTAALVLVVNRQKAFLQVRQNAEAFGATEEQLANALAAAEADFEETIDTEVIKILNELNESHPDRTLFLNSSEVGEAVREAMGEQDPMDAMITVAATSLVVKKEELESEALNAEIDGEVQKLLSDFDVLFADRTRLSTAEEIREEVVRVMDVLDASEPDDPVEPSEVAA